MASNMIPPPPAMDCTGDVDGNWEFFVSSSTVYTELCEKTMIIRIATFRSILGRDAIEFYNIYNFILRISVKICHP